jgi:ribosomal protein L37E
MAQKAFAANARREFRRHLSGAGPKGVVVSVECTKCHKKILSAMKWHCANCGFDNQRTELYSFLNKCQKCESVPSAVVCPHCSTMMFFTDERDAQFAARQVVEEKKPPQKVDPSQREARAHSREKLRLDREIELAELKGKLARARRAAEPKAAPTEDEKMDTEIRAYVARIMGQHKAISRAQEQAAIDYKDDEDGLQKVMMALEQWREAHIQP